MPVQLANKVQEELVQSDPMRAHTQAPERAQTKGQAKVAAATSDIRNWRHLDLTADASSIEAQRQLVAELAARPDVLHAMRATANMTGAAAQSAAAQRTGKKRKAKKAPGTDGDAAETEGAAHTREVHKAARADVTLAPGGATNAAARARPARPAASEDEEDSDDGGEDVEVDEEDEDEEDAISVVEDSGDDEDEDGGEPEDSTHRAIPAVFVPVSGRSTSAVDYDAERWLAQAARDVQDVAAKTGVGHKRVKALQQKATTDALTAKAQAALDGRADKVELFDNYLTSFANLVDVVSHGLTSHGKIAYPPPRRAAAAPVV